MAVSEAVTLRKAFWSSLLRTERAGGEADLRLCLLAVSFLVSVSFLFVSSLLLKMISVLRQIGLRRPVVLPSFLRPFTSTATTLADTPYKHVTLEEARAMPRHVR